MSIDPCRKENMSQSFGRKFEKQVLQKHFPALTQTRKTFGCDQCVVVADLLLSILLRKKNKLKQLYHMKKGEVLRAILVLPPAWWTSKLFCDMLFPLKDHKCQKWRTWCRMIWMNLSGLAFLSLRPTLRCSWSWDGWDNGRGIFAPRDPVEAGAGCFEKHFAAFRWKAFLWPGNVDQLPV